MKEKSETCKENEIKHRDYVNNGVRASGYDFRASDQKPLVCMSKILFFDNFPSRIKIGKRKRKITDGKGPSVMQSIFMRLLDIL
jgi:hypothetical protein